MTESKPNNSVDLRNILNKFKKKTNLTEKYIKKTKELLEGKDLDYIISEEKEIAKTWVIHPIESYEDLLKEKFYESVGEYILEGNYDKLSEKILIILLFGHIQPKLIYQIIKYVYPLSDQNVKSIFNYRYIVYINLALEIKSDVNKLLDNKDYDGLDLKTNEYYELANNLINDGIILNNLYPVNIDQKSAYKNMSIYDLFVHASYICENYHTSLLWLKIILDKLPSITDNEYFIFNNEPVNINSLDLLADIVTERNSKYINLIIREYNKRKDDYYNTFIFYLNKLYYYMKKRNVLDKYKLNHKDIKYYIDKYYSEIFVLRPINIKRLDLNCIHEYTSLINDVVNIGHHNLYEFFLRCFNESKNLNPIQKIYVILIWTRSIYLHLDKYNSILSFDILSNEYYVMIDKKKIIISKEEYLTDIISYLNDVDVYITDFIMEQIENFVTQDYYEIKLKQNTINEIQDKNIKCVVCLDNIDNIDNIENTDIDNNLIKITNSNDLIKCINCKNIFHESCINKMFLLNQDYCPICQKPVLNVLLTYSDIKYNFFNDILKKHKENK